MRVHKRILSIFLFFGLLFSGCKNDLQKDQPELSFSEQWSGNELIGASCCNCGTNLKIHSGYETGEDICNICNNSTPYKILKVAEDTELLNNSFSTNKAGVTAMRDIFTEQGIDLKDTEILKTYYPEFFDWSGEENKSLTKNISINIRAHERNKRFASKDFSKYIFRIGHAITTNVQYLNKDGRWIGASSQISTTLGMSKFDEANLSTIKNFLFKIFNKTSFDAILDNKQQNNITINISFGKSFSVPENTQQDGNSEKITYTIEKIDDGIIQISKLIDIYKNDFQDTGWYMYFDKESKNNNVDWFNEFTYNEMEEQKTETQDSIGNYENILNNVKNILNNVYEYNEEISRILEKYPKEAKQTIGKLKIYHGTVRTLSEILSLDIQGKDTESNLKKIQSKLKDISSTIKGKIGQLGEASKDLDPTTFEFPKRKLNTISTTIDTEIESICTSVSDLSTKTGEKQKNSHFGIPISYEKSYFPKLFIEPK